MKKKIVITSIISVLVLLAAIVAGLNAIFSVGEVKAEFSVRTDAARRESVALQAELDVFVGKSTVLLDLKEVEDVVAKYPYFQLDEISKQYPQAIVLKLTERQELFAVQTQTGYRMFDTEGTFLSERESNANRADGAENILLCDIAEGSADFTTAVQILNAMGESISHLRMSIKTVTLVQKASDAFELIVQTSEGVTLRFYDPSVQGAEKARLVAAKYLSLADEERMYGEVYAIVTNDGSLVCEYIGR